MKLNLITNEPNKVHHSGGRGSLIHTYMCIECGWETRSYMKPFRCHKCKGKMERI